MGVAAAAVALALASTAPAADELRFETDDWVFTARRLSARRPTWS